MDYWMTEMMKVMGWLPFVDIIPEPALIRPFWPSTRFQCMPGRYRRFPNRIYKAREPIPLDPPITTHPIKQPILRQWPSSENMQKINIQDYRIDNFMRTTRLPDPDPHTGWVLGLPHRQWRPLLFRDIKKKRANFYGHFDYPSNGGFMERKLKAKIIKKGYPYLGIAPPPKPVVKSVDRIVFHGGYRVPPSKTFNFTFEAFSDKRVDRFKYDIEFSPPTAPSITDSETPLGIFDDERKHKCGKINQLVMYIDQKLEYFKDIPPWHRVQIGVPALRIIQAIYTIFYLTVVHKHCENNGSDFCNFIRSNNWRNILPFFLAYFAIALPVIPYMPLPWILFWYKTFRSFNAYVFVIQTMIMAHISSAMYMHKSVAVQKIIFEYQFGLILASLFLIAYFRVKFDRQLENMPYWNIFVGCKENKEEYWISTYYGRSDTRGFITYSALIRQYHDIFEQAKMNDSIWMRKRAIMNDGIAIYFIVCSALFPTLCHISVWLKQYLGAVLFNFGLGMGMSVYQLWWMHHLFIYHPLNDYHWGDIFMFAIIT